MLSFGFQNTKNLLIAGVEANVTYPREALKGVNQQFAKIQVKNIEDSEFYNGFR